MIVYGGEPILLSASGEAQRLDDAPATGRPVGMGQPREGGGVAVPPHGVRDDRVDLGHLAGCDIRLVTGHGPWEDSGPTYRMSEVLHSRGVAHSVDDWGPDGGHDWPYWKRQMDLYVGRLF